MAAEVDQLAVEIFLVELALGQQHLDGFRRFGQLEQRHLAAVRRLAEQPSFGGSLEREMQGFRRTLLGVEAGHGGEAVVTPEEGAQVAEPGLLPDQGRPQIGGAADDSEPAEKNHQPAEQEPAGSLVKDLGGVAFVGPEKHDRDADAEHQENGAHQDADPRPVEEAEHAGHDQGADQRRAPGELLAETGWPFGGGFGFGTSGPCGWRLTGRNAKRTAFRRPGLWRLRPVLPLKVELDCIFALKVEAPMNKHHPFHPIIYVRGFAATQGEIEDTVADPYMGFNIGSTKARMAWTGNVQRFYFESPLVRLMTDDGYDDVFVDGEDLTTIDRPGRGIAYQSIVIFRYYDEASEDFGSGKTPPIRHFAQGLDTLILNLKKRICGNPKNEVAPEDFRVYLVAHSMGGLICRAFLQNPQIGSAEARAAVDKVFTYATPHNGIDMRVVNNVPGWVSFGDVNNFNREKMAGYFGLKESDDVSLVENFPAERIFNLVGTNPADYTAAGGLSSWAVGHASDGLVRIENAVTRQERPDGSTVLSPRAFVHRSHSGHYGIVNSEEGFQNLTRFLFGSLRIDGILDVDDITLPIEVLAELKSGKKVEASYHFRGDGQRARLPVADDARARCAKIRRSSALTPSFSRASRAPSGRPTAATARTFFGFPRSQQSVKTTGSVAFAFDLKVLVPDYVVDGVFFLKRHFEGGYILRQMILVAAFPTTPEPSGWRIKYGYQETNPGKPGVDAKAQPLASGENGICFDIPVEQKTARASRTTCASRRGPGRKPRSSGAAVQAAGGRRAGRGRSSGGSPPRCRACRRPCTSARSSGSCRAGRRRSPRSRRRGRPLRSSGAGNRRRCALRARILVRCSGERLSSSLASRARVLGFAEHQAQVAGDDLASRSRGSSLVFGGRHDLFFHQVEREVDDREEQRFLAFDVVVEAALGEVHRLRDVAHRGGAESPAVEDVGRLAVDVDRALVVADGGGFERKTSQARE